MAISAEGKIGIGLALLFGLGAGAALVWPAAKIIAIVMTVVAAVGLIALLIYHVWPRPAQPEPSTDDAPLFPGGFFVADNGGSINANGAKLIA